MGSQRAYSGDTLPGWDQSEKWKDQNLEGQHDNPKELLLSGLSNGTCNGVLNKRTEKNQDRSPYGDSVFLNDCNFHVSSSSSSSSSSSTSSCSFTDGAGNGSTSICISPSKDDIKFPSEKGKTALSLGFFQTALFLNLTSLAVIHERVPRGPPLPDMGFDLLPETPIAQNISENIMIVGVVATFFILAVHRHRFIILRRIFLILGLLYLMRSVTMFVTQLPVSNSRRYCAPNENSTSVALIARRVVHMMSGFGMITNGKHICCGDYIYSGHTVTLTMVYLVISEYTPSRWALLHRISWLTSFTGIACLIFSRGHYTIDILIAYYVTTRTFWIYHTLANNQTLKNPGRNNYLSRLWWFYLFRYFEQNVGGVVPIEFDWPLPWPRRWLRRARNS